MSVALCTPRFLAAFTIAPFFNPQLITGLTRNCIAISFALILFPIIFPSIGDRNLSMLAFFGIIAKESVIGVAFGFMIGLFFWGIEAIGGLIDRQRGADMAEVFNPVSGSQTTVMGNFLMQLSVLLFISADGFLIFLSAMYESYQIWPILSYLPKPGANYVPFFLERIDDFMEMTLLIASPVLIVMFLSELGLGLINRFAPQLNVFFLSMPIKSASALFILIIYFPFLVSYLKKLLAQHADVLKTLKLIMQ
jgi:type III secretion protein T